MPFPRPSPRLLRSPNSCLSKPHNSRQFAQSTTRNAHGPSYDPPSGWLWGIPPGQKVGKEGWEGIAYWGIAGSLIATTVAYAYKPDTSIQTWALEEARRRLEAEGILKDPESAQ